MVTRSLLILFALLAAKDSWSTDTARLKKDTTINEAVGDRIAAPAKISKPRLVRGDGYRLQVLKTRDRKKALLMKAEMMQDFPGTEVYMVYRSPYFRIRIGNFTTKKDAVRFRTTQLSHLSKVYAVKQKIVYMWHPPPQNRNP